MRLKHSLLLPLLFVAGLAFPQILVAQSYSVIDLDAADSRSSRAVAINQQGEVTGTIWNTTAPKEPLGAGFSFPTHYSGQQNPGFFIYSHGKTEAFSASGFGNAVLSINAHSEVVGTARGNPLSHARHSDPFIFSHGNFSYLRDLLPRTHTLVFPDIAGQNDSGQILCTGLYGKVAIFDHGRLTYLDAPSKQRAEKEHQVKTGGSWAPIIINGQRTTIFQPDYQEQLVHDLPLGPCKFNNKGHISGILANGHAFLYANGVCTEVGVPLGLYDCQVAAFNDNDEIVGMCYDGRDAPRMFCYSHGKVDFFKPKERLASIKPTAVNNNGIVVGVLTIPNIKNNVLSDYSDRAFVFTNGGMRDLNASIDPKSGWVLEAANGINDKGQIVGTGSHNGKTRAFLMTPKR